MLAGDSESHVCIENPVEPHRTPENGVLFLSQSPNFGLQIIYEALQYIYRWGFPRSIALRNQLQAFIIYCRGSSSAFDDNMTSTAISGARHINSHLIATLPDVQALTISPSAARSLFITIFIPQARSSLPYSSNRSRCKAWPSASATTRTTSTHIAPPFPDDIQTLPDSSYPYAAHDSLHDDSGSRIPALCPALASSR